MSDYEMVPPFLFKEEPAMSSQVLTDELWNEIDAFFPVRESSSDGGRPPTDNRTVTCILFVLKTGIALGRSAPRTGLLVQDLQPQASRLDRRGSMAAAVAAPADAVAAMGRLDRTRRYVMSRA